MDRSAVQSQKAVSAHFTSEQILPFGFAESRGAERGQMLMAYPACSEGAGPTWWSAANLIINLYAALKSRRAVTAHLKSKQILPFGFALQYKATSVVWHMKLVMIVSEVNFVPKCQNVYRYKHLMYHICGLVKGERIRMFDGNVLTGFRYGQFPQWHVHATLPCLLHHKMIHKDYRNAFYFLNRDKRYAQLTLSARGPTLYVRFWPQ